MNKSTKSKEEILEEIKQTLDEAEKKSFIRDYLIEIETRLMKEIDDLTKKAKELNEGLKKMNGKV